MKKIFSHILFFSLWSIIVAPVVIFMSLQHIGMHHESAEQNCVEHCISQIDIRSEASIPLLPLFKKFLSSILPHLFLRQEIIFFTILSFPSALYITRFWRYKRKDYTALIGIIKSTT